MNDSKHSHLEPIVRIPVTEVVAKRIISLIGEGNYNVGDKLPSQKEFVEMLHVSRPTLREALTGLTMLGYIESRAGLGYFIQKVPGDPATELLGISELSEELPIQPLFEARCNIEPRITAMAAARATKDDIDGLYTFLEKVDQLLPSVEALEEGLKFHVKVAQIARNPILLEIETALIMSFSENMDIVFSDVPTEYREVDAHKVIIEQISKQNVEGSRLAALEHLLVFAEEAGLCNFLY